MSEDENAAVKDAFEATHEPASIQRFNNLGGLMNPAPNGLYVRYEDHIAAIARNSSAPPQSADDQTHE